MKKRTLLDFLTMTVVVVMSMVLTACPPPDDPSLSVDKTSVTLAANGDGDKDISVSASHTDWTASVTEGSSWLRVNKNGQLATISVDENRTSASRTGKIKIVATKDASLYKEVSVNQAGADGTISVSVDNVEFGPKGGTQTISVMSNSAWNMSGNQAWLTVSPTSSDAPASGSESKDVTLKVGENTTNDAQSCTLSFTTKDGKGSATVTVRQKEPTPFVLVNGLTDTSLRFSSKSGINYKQTVKVSSNVSWSISNTPDWLSVSPTSGNGEVSLEIYPKTDNDMESKDRSVQLKLLANETAATINVTQETGLDPDAYVKPTSIVTLYNGIAFDYIFGKNVSYYYRGYMDKTIVASWTEAEIISELELRFNRLILNDNELAVFDGLEPGKTYMVYTLGYNKDGKRGELTKTEIQTKTLQNNEPLAWIGEPSYDSSYWYWTIEKSASCNSYYMFTTEDYVFAKSPDVYQAWTMDYWIRKNSLSEFVNGGNWLQEKKGNVLTITTWGLDKKGNFSNTIERYQGQISSSSIKKIGKKKTAATVRNYPKLKNGKISLFRRTK